MLAYPQAALPGMARVAIGCLLLALGGCIGGPPPATDRFIGPGTPDAASKSAGCIASQALLDMKGNAFVLVPDGGVTVVHGTVSTSGALSGQSNEIATMPRQNSMGQAISRPVAEFHGQRQGRLVTGTARVLDCVSTVALHQR